jgi:hypothetical protein
LKLPGADKAVVERAKIMDYLLNAEHPENGGKAKFFLGLGFKRNDWQSLAAAFRNAVVNQPVSKTMASSHGTKYIVDSRIETPSGKTPLVRTVWIIDIGLDTPRLVTVFPHGE